MTRVLLSEQSSLVPADQIVFQRGNWAAEWIDHPARPLNAPSAALFRLRFTVETPSTVRIHVSADNRYQLALDGAPVGRGPERGDPLHWRFETYELALAPGEHTLAAFTWWLGALAPYAQMTVRPGFLLAAEGAWEQRLSTGIAPWEASLVEGYTFTPTASYKFYCAGARVRIDGARAPWGWQEGAGTDWQPVTRIASGKSAPLAEYAPYWVLTPATLPPMMSEMRRGGRLCYLTDDAETPYPVRLDAHLPGEAMAWQAWLAGTRSVTVPAGATRTAVIDLGEYYCAYPHLRVSGGAGAEVRLHWAEALYEQPEYRSKGNRDVVEGKYYLGYGDTFLPDGGDGRTFTPPWWFAGRYLELRVTTGETPLVLESLALEETRYPLEMQGDFRAADDRLEAVTPIAVRALQMCSHETYMDCPYYEQMMYAGDTRLEALTTYVLTRDDRLPRRALTAFDESRLVSGLTQSRFPSMVAQIIPPFSLWWVGMVHDYWLWRDDPAFVRQRMPGVRAVTEYFRTLLQEDGLLGVPQGWNFTDWVPGWPAGIPPQADTESNGILNLQYALLLLQKAEIEASLGEEQLAARDRHAAGRLGDAALRHFWSADRGLFANDLAQTSFSEHAQCLALLSGLFPAQRESLLRGLITAPDLSRTTIYFSHYLFETLYQAGRTDILLDRLTFWMDLVSQGFKTTVEAPEPSRSDCHAWGAHPVFHYYASLLGIRPAAPGFRRVRIAPELGPLAWAEGTLPHPAGNIHVRVDRRERRAWVDLPAYVDGTFQWAGETFPLQAGENTLAF